MVEGSDLTPLNEGAVQVGQMCIAEFDTLWFRAKIETVRDQFLGLIFQFVHALLLSIYLQVNEADKNVTIHYVDYGNRERKSFDELYSIDSQLDYVKTAPPMCIACSFEDLVPCGSDDYSDQANEIFAELLDSTIDVGFIAPQLLISVSRTSWNLLLLILLLLQLKAVVARRDGEVLFLKQLIPLDSNGKETEDVAEKLISLSYAIRP